MRKSFQQKIQTETIIKNDDDFSHVMVDKMLVSYSRRDSAHNINTHGRELHRGFNFISRNWTLFRRFLRSLVLGP